MADRLVRTEPLLDDHGKPVTLFGFPVVVSPDLPSTPGITLGRAPTEADAPEILAALRKGGEGAAP